MKRRVTIGSRGSRLALIQAELVAAELREIDPGLEIAIRQIVTRGDRNPHLQLDRMAGIGVFVKELEEALLNGQIDLAVHSLKDMPTELPPGLRLLAAAERLDPRDVLISRGGKLAELAPGARIGTGSLRRASQLKACRPDLEACSIRGNVDTRLRKVAEGEFAGVILAAAALKRLGWEEKISEYLPLEYFLPAVGQGALGIEARSDDEEIAQIVSPLNHPPTWQSVTAERALLRALGGGCRAPIAALGTVNGATLKLEAMVADMRGERIVRSAEEGSAAEPEKLGVKLAQKLLALGAAEFIAEAKQR
ncbi:MAG TPA: hydroxymethylbilane synthase [Dehalococcoidia bacterium]|jgi:hydroxymethylbilane synthase|nr:hydroxymethylbilane synthase [Dehalococcoidia bacterium]